MGKKEEKWGKGWKNEEKEGKTEKGKEKWEMGRKTGERERKMERMLQSTGWAKLWGEFEQDLCEAQTDRGMWEAVGTKLVSQNGGTPVLQEQEPCVAPALLLSQRSDLSHRPSSPESRPGRGGADDHGRAGEGD